MMSSNVALQSSVKFGRGGSMIRAPRLNEFLSDEAIARNCPAVFAEDKHASRSEKYTYVPTVELLAGFRKEGFFPVEVRQGGSKDEVKRGFTKHMIRFRRSDNLLKQVGDSLQELVLLNAHDGTSSYQFMSGWLKVACMNGLVVADKDRQGDAIKIGHRGNIMHEVIEASYRVIDETESQVKQIEDMNRIGLTYDEERAFATSAAALRFTEDQRVEPTAILRAHRREDHNNSIWSTFNRVQENLVRGGITYRSTDENGKERVRHAREVKGIDGNLNLNRALWVLAEEMRRLKTAA